MAELARCWKVDDELDALDRLLVLSRVVKECLRLYPPTHYMSHELGEDDVLEGYCIPKGTIVHVPILALHRDGNIWGADEAAFDPDRFLDEEHEQRTKMFWLPFMCGPRSCIGKRFALLEIKAFAAQVLIRQQVYIKPLEDPSPTVFGLFGSPRGMKLCFEARENI